MHGKHTLSQIFMTRRADTAPAVEKCNILHLRGWCRREAGRLEHSGECERVRGFGLAGNLGLTEATAQEMTFLKQPT